MASRRFRPLSLLICGFGLSTLSCPAGELEAGNASTTFGKLGPPSPGTGPELTTLSRPSPSSLSGLGAPDAGAGEAGIAGALASPTVVPKRPAPPPVDELEGAQPGSWPEPTTEEMGVLERQIAARQAAAAVGPAPLVDPAVEEPPEVVAAEQAIESGRGLVAVARITHVYAKPSFEARKLGYLRAGAVVRRALRRAGTRGCPGGFFAIEPRGYVCVGDGASLDVHHPLAQIAGRRADRSAALPYIYGMTRGAPPPLYAKVPSPEVQSRVEGAAFKSSGSETPSDWAVPMVEVPPFLSQGGRGLFWRGAGGSDSAAQGESILGRAVGKSGFSFLSFFEEEGRRWGLTPDLEVVPLNRLRRIESSRFHGLALDAQTTLPVVFVRGSGQSLYQGNPLDTLVPERPLAHREALPITQRRLSRGGVEYLETRDGHWIRNSGLVRVDPPRNRPGWATPGRTWIEVSILQQSLVAYEGAVPVYVTLVSTGADGLGDPKETHSTVQGQFLIHTKHVTTTMSGDEVGDEFDLRDVPYVQYFTEGYALHAAYWHDGFGQPRSHGCINLSPIDARWLFQWTEPPVPPGWHGALSLTEGTLIDVHP